MAGHANGAVYSKSPSLAPLPSSSGRVPCRHNVWSLNSKVIRRLRRNQNVLMALPSSQADSQQQNEQPANDRIKQTIAGLDALLGINEEQEKEEKESKEPEPAQVAVSIAPEVLKAIAEAEKQRAGNAIGSPEVNRRVTDSIGRIVEQARKLSEAPKDDDSTAGESAMRKEFENLLSVLTSPRGMDPSDMQLLKDKVFGPQTFWMTETVPAPGLPEGVVVRGNFRGPREPTFAKICEDVEQLFGDKYIVKLVEERDWEGMDPGAAPRVVLQILPMEAALPTPVAGWQRGVAVLLLALTVGSSFQLGLAANVGLLPRETLQWLANPANINAEVLPPGLENFDPSPWLQSSAIVAGLAFLPQLGHELAHRITAGIKGIKTGPSFLIPNGQLGTFGSITQLKSLAKNRTDLFDFSASGLIAGGVISMGLFIAGLAISDSTATDAVGLVPIPAALFQGSLLLGGLAKLGLGADAVAKSSVMVSPLMIGGWCGLVATALNALPVGNLDGGRTMLSAYGRNTLAFTSLASYVGLGLGLLGSSLALPFGLYILICQREAENNIQDEVSEVDQRRKAVALALMVFAVLILLPGVPDAVDLGLMGPPANFL